MSAMAGDTLDTSDGINNRAWPHVMLHLVKIIHGTDNQSPVDALNSTKSVTEKILCLEINSIRKLIQTKRIDVRKVGTEY